MIIRYGLYIDDWKMYRYGLCTDYWEISRGGEPRGGRIGYASGDTGGGKNIFY